MFWENEPSTDSPISADNLSRPERFTIATSAVNGDFSCTIQNGGALATNDIVRIAFGAATNSASNARLSINGGTNYYNIKTKAGAFVPASQVESRRVELFNLGGEWFPVEPIIVGYKNQSVAQQTGFSTATYLTGSFIVFPYPPKVGTTYKLTFDVTKTAAGTATPIIQVRLGTAGTVSDSSRVPFTFGAGTAAIDSGLFEVICTFRTVGSGTSAVLQGVSRLTSNLTTTGISNAVKAVQFTSSGFDSTVAGLGIGASYNAGASAAHTIELVRAELIV